MKPTFEKTVDILVKAYLNDTLEHGNCAACAVGNIVVSVHGYQYYSQSPLTGLKVDEIITYDNWYSVLTGHESYRGRKEIEKTGYSFKEIRRIEAAFERSRDLPDRMFNGLMAVVNVLADIHGVDLQAKEEAKALFVKA